MRLVGIKESHCFMGGAEPCDMGTIEHAREASECWLNAAIHWTHAAIFVPWLVEAFDSAMLLWQQYI